ncbi:UDP-3-O-(3-hydroxymyristoyl)glucosamine N-acyltransferase [Psychroflexus planctonicus]|uniref:UDP-3-O-acylglucosamine N-acyltransferase n=1 Tax=Psychroflexus planctonicus TaxID=1526575 RepID=A0ABQ1SFN5_9FLAO|nr:UDP-3-O-(3-hydroxymyristoyl)glucosamine N-acyltransferase [Psychroflexus planctonicus]GGE26841.1 UDP-3-O-acylglucosamine N-acyltransferase [Psychroflexus planctonicus]
MTSMNIETLASKLKGEVIGNQSIEIHSLAQLGEAKEGQLTFIGHKKYEKDWANSSASAAIINADSSLQPGEGKAFIKVENANFGMIEALHAFAPPLPQFDSDIHPTAIIDESASIGNSVKIGAGVYIGPEVKLDDGVIIYPNVTILDHSTIGKATQIWSGAVIRERTQIGAHCIIHPNASIGADGFGFEPHPQKGLVKVPQIGNVVIGNYVEIGANSCVDRAKFASTILGDGCKIDNLVQIGHNSKLGMFCIMAGNSGLAGSVTLGNGVVIGGSASIKDHTTIGDGATVGAGSGVTGDVEAGKTVLGYPAVEGRTALKQWAILKRLATKGS